MAVNFLEGLLKFWREISQAILLITAFLLRIPSRGAQSSKKLGGLRGAQIQKAKELTTPAVAYEGIIPSVWYAEEVTRWTLKYPIPSKQPMENIVNPRTGRTISRFLQHWQFFLCSELRWIITSLARSSFWSAECDLWLFAEGILLLRLEDKKFTLQFPS